MPAVLPLSHDDPAADVAASPAAGVGPGTRGLRPEHERPLRVAGPGQEEGRGLASDLGPGGASVLLPALVSEHSSGHCGVGCAPADGLVLELRGR